MSRGETVGHSAERDEKPSSGLLRFWCCLLFLGPATAFAQTPVTFSEAMNMVEQRNERWRAADLAVRRARESREEQRGLHWPTVAMVGRYAHFNHELFVD